MSTLWLNEDYMKIRTYSASVRGPKAVVKVEIEVNDPAHLGFLLEDIAKVQKEMAAKERAHPARARSKASQVEQVEPLQIPYFGDDK